MQNGPSRNDVTSRLLFMSPFCNATQNPFDSDGKVHCWLMSIFFFKISFLDDLYPTYLKYGWIEAQKRSQSCHLEEGPMIATA